MRVQVKKWGNSLAVRIPKTFAAESKIKDGSTVDVSLDGEKIVVKAADQPSYTLEELLSKVTRRNRHGEIGTGAPTGNEVW